MIDEHKTEIDVSYKEKIAPKLSHDKVHDIAQTTIAEIDRKITEQLNLILHHPEFQRLEASWRGLQYLTDQCGDIGQLKIRILDISWSLFAKDLNYALEFDQSQLFKKIYTNEIDLPGGEPFGILIGDYYISHQSDKNHSTTDTLRRMAKISAAAFAPFVVASSAKFFGLDDFSQFKPSLNLRRIFEQSEYSQWKNLRSEEDARFIGVMLPRVLLRLPYNLNCHSRVDQFCFKEYVQSPTDYLWGNAAYCLAAVVARAFHQQGWFTEIRGTELDMISKGMVTGLQREYLAIGNFGLNYKPATEVLITSNQEKELSNLGFIALCECQYTQFCAFYSCQSIQLAKIYDRTSATANAQLSTMLHYILCVSRFAHYIKVLMRNKVGTFSSAEECQSFLQNWLLGYTAITDGMSQQSKAKYPLREVKIEVRKKNDKPGSYFCIMQLRPHFQLDSLEASLTLLTEIPV
jgi:type VI secretion system protein ImpD